MTQEERARRAAEPTSIAIRAYCNRTNRDVLYRPATVGNRDAITRQLHDEGYEYVDLLRDRDPMDMSELIDVEIWVRPSRMYVHYDEVMEHVDKAMNLRDAVWGVRSWGELLGYDPDKTKGE